MPHPRKIFPNRGRITIDLGLNTHLRLNALVERRPNVSRTAVIAGLIHDAYAALSMDERRIAEQTWPRPASHANVPLTSTSELEDVLAAFGEPEDDDGISDTDIDE